MKLRILILASIAAASGLAAFNPQEASDYLFTSIPGPTYITVGNNPNYSEIMECYPSFPQPSRIDGGIKVCGYLKRYPIRGMALSDKILRHENLLYISELVNERTLAVSGGKRGPLAYNLSSKSLFDVGAFTNKYIRCAPDGTSALVYEKTDEAIPDYEEDLGVDRTPPEFTYTPPSLNGKPPSIADLSGLVDALGAFSSAVYHQELAWELYYSCMTFKECYGGVGTVPSGTWDWNSHKFTPSELPTGSEEPEMDMWPGSGANGAYIKWDYYHWKHRQWYLDGWDGEKFTEVKQGRDTAQFTSDIRDLEDVGILEDGEQFFGVCSTNGLLAGGVNRAVKDDQFCAHMVRVYYEKKVNQETVEKFGRWVVIPDFPNGPFTPQEHGIPGCNYMAMSTGKSLKDILLEALEECGIEWMETVEAETPPEGGAGDVTESWSKEQSGNHTCESSVHMEAHYHGCFNITFGVEFSTP